MRFIFICLYFGDYRILIILLCRSTDTAWRPEVTEFMIECKKTIKLIIVWVYFVIS